MTFRPSFYYSALLAGLAAPVTGWAAGGHHVVDDATILDPGTCHVESWVQRSRGDSGVLTTLTPACHVRGFELGVTVDQDRTAGADLRTFSPEIKWVTALGESPIAVGAFASLTYQDDTRRWEGYALNLIQTWDAAVAQVHLNLGYDGARGGGGTHRLGVGADWALGERFELLTEGYREFNQSFGRVGGRSILGPVMLDLSYAAQTQSGGARLWTAGLTVEF